jgi:hypothetical protein
MHIVISLGAKPTGRQRLGSNLVCATLVDAPYRGFSETIRFRKVR